MEITCGLPLGLAMQAYTHVLPCVFLFTACWAMKLSILEHRQISTLKKMMNKRDNKLWEFVCFMSCSTNTVSVQAGQKPGAKAGYSSPGRHKGQETGAEVCHVNGVGRAGSSPHDLLPEGG